VSDVVDRAQIVEEDQLAELVERQRRAAALDKPGSRECIDCGDQIPRERRRALPSATRCIGCQDEAERVAHIRRTRTP